MKGRDGKLDQRNCTFTTEHKVSEKERNRNARTVAAEFSTADKDLIEAMYQDSGYGKTFVHKDDPEAKRKQATLKITALDATKTALKNLFDIAGLLFDENKPVEVLNKEYSIHVAAKSGVILAKGEASTIPHQPVDIQKSMQDQASSAIASYEEKYGEPMPDEFKNDLGFLSALLSDPKFDAKAYIQSKSNSVPKEKDDADGNDLPDDPESLGKLYLERFGVNVPNPKKNNGAWIKEKLLAPAE